MTEPWFRATKELEEHPIRTTGLGEMRRSTSLVALVFGRAEQWAAEGHRPDDKGRMWNNSYGLDIVDRDSQD
jgi:hypothetical protein